MSQKQLKQLFEEVAKQDSEVLQKLKSKLADKLVNKSQKIRENKTNQPGATGIQDKLNIEARDSVSVEKFTEKNDDR